VSLLNFSKQQLTRAFIKKINLSFRAGKERNAWFELDGRKILRVTMPKGRGPLTPGTARAIQDQVKLSTQEYADLIKCPLLGKDYEVIIRKKMQRGLL
jgi:hypothetical protein